jgi:hypothetical protein
MARRKDPAKLKAAALDKLRPEEAVAVLRQLLADHPELRSEAETIATEVMSTPSIEDVAEDVYQELTRIDLAALSERAGSHSWGYVEPSEAAAELLTEAVEDWVEEMKRSLELGLLEPAESLCIGIVQGLYRARDTDSDGALGWAVDFPAEEASEVVEEFLKGCHPPARIAAEAKLMRIVAEQYPEWVEILQRVAERVRSQ